MKKQDFLFVFILIVIFLPFFVSDAVYGWYKSFNAAHGMIMSFLKFGVLATLGEMLGLRISAVPEYITEKDLECFPVRSYGVS